MRVSEIFFTPRNVSLEKHASFSSNRKPVLLDGGASANAELLRGIYYGTAQSFSLGSYLAQNFVNIPAAFIGSPKIIGIYDKEFLSYFEDEWALIKRAALVYGTAWRWARWDINKNTCILEAIQDESINIIQLDIDTQDIAYISAEENIQTWGENASPITINRTREWTADSVITTIDGKKTERVNMHHAMPIPYAHDCWEGEWRGHSVFSRVLRNIRSLHEIMYKREEILSQFTPKLVLKLGDMSSDRFMQVNRLDRTNGTMDPYSMDMVLLTGTADCSFMTPGDVTSAHTSCIEDIQKKIIMGSGLPELFFGGLSTGTEAASDGQVRIALNYIKSKQTELKTSLRRQLKDVAKILSFMGKAADPDEVDVSFDSINISPEADKQAIQSGFIDTVIAMKDAEILTPRLIQYMGTQLFSDWPYATGEEALAEFTKQVPPATDSGMGADDLGATTSMDDAGGAPTEPGVPPPTEE